MVGKTIPLASHFVKLDLQLMLSADFTRAGTVRLID